MKLRIQDNSVRMRIVPRELDELVANGRIEAATELYDATGKLEARLVFGAALVQPGEESRCAITPGSIYIYLTRDDLDQLRQPDREGVYLRKESTLPSGKRHRFMAFVEKDRAPKKPGRESRQPEAWLYEED